MVGLQTGQRILACRFDVLCGQPHAFRVAGDLRGDDDLVPDGGAPRGQPLADHPLGLAARVALHPGRARVRRVDVVPPPSVQASSTRTTCPSRRSSRLHSRRARAARRRADRSSYRRSSACCDVGACPTREELRFDGRAVSRPVDGESLRRQQPAAAPIESGLLPVDHSADGLPPCRRCGRRYAARRSGPSGVPTRFGCRARRGYRSGGGCRPRRRCRAPREHPPG